MTEEPAWLTKDDVLAAHARQLQVFGGGSGLRDEGGLESAIARPQNKWRYESADFPELAAGCAFGIVRNHPFADGNKRAGFMAMIGFLMLNEIDFAPDPVESTAIILALAAGEVDETGLSRWIRDNWPTV